MSNKVYNIGSYRIIDNHSDKILFPGEVLIKTPSGDYRKLNVDEWKKFTEVPAIMGKHNFLPIRKQLISGELILKALEMNPASLQKIVEELGGVARVILILENYFAGESNSKLEQTFSELKKWEDEFKLYTQFVNEIPKEKVFNLLIVPGLLHSDAIETFSGFLSDEEQKLPVEERAKLVAKKIMQDEALFLSLRKIFTVSGFLFGQKGLGYELNGQLKDALLRGKTDCDRFTSLFIHFGSLAGLDVDLYAFNDHVVPIFKDFLFPGGSFVVESTSGFVTDAKFYIEHPQIPCLKLGIPISAFEYSSEQIVVSAILQHVNDCYEKQDFPNAIRYLELVDRIRPGDVSTYMLFQMIYMDAGNKEKAEEYRKKSVEIIQRYNKK